MTSYSNCNNGDGRYAEIEISSASLRFRKYGDRYPSIKQTILNTLLRRSYSSHSDFWLFQDINLKIEHGQRLGIIGPNGAGKSTLLKLICGIYHPTTGTIRVRGRIAPLIELGAGFNPELSGIENIYLNGALLGFGPKAMETKVRGILEFAGLWDFAETPVKYYSTGMTLRLAFSIATDIEPEILMVDEVFAGGDAEFVKKASNRMMELVGNSKITVLVSHNLDLIKKMCDRTIWLEKGKIIMDGDSAEVCNGYMNRQSKTA